MLMFLFRRTGDGLSNAQPAQAASSSAAGSQGEGVDVLLAWQAASPLDESPCRGYSHLYGVRLQVCWHAACAASVAQVSTGLCPRCRVTRQHGCAVS